MNCVARTMEFINRHAYVQIALKGENFCKSAWEGLFGVDLAPSIIKFPFESRSSLLLAIRGQFYIASHSALS